MRKLFLVALSLTMVTISCARHNAINKEKFERLYRAGKAVETYPAPFDLFEEDVQISAALKDHVKNLEIECAAAKGLASTIDEKRMVDLYVAASASFNLGMMSCQQFPRLSGALKQAMGLWDRGLDMVKLANQCYTDGDCEITFHKQQANGD